MIEQMITVTITSELSGKRLDAVLGYELSDYSRSFLQKLISQGLVSIEGKQKLPKASYKVSENEKILVQIPEPEPLDILPQDIALDIVYEDEDVLVVNKPQGMVVHPAAGHTSDTLVNALMYHCQGCLSGINGVLRPGIVHRIDKDTSGLLVVCKNDQAHRAIAEQLKVHSITRRYQAIVYGHFKEEQGTVDAPIGRHPQDRKKMAIEALHGKPARTHYKVLQSLQKNCSLIECSLETGRTHQIRVHMTSLQHPLVGDPVYGTGSKGFPADGQMLHASILGFLHPRTGEYMEFEAKQPKHFVQMLQKLGGTVDEFEE